MSMERCELAHAYHQKGYNCCQSVLAAFSDLTGLSEKDSLAIGGGFGRGSGGGKGLGLGKGGQESGHTVSPANVVRTAASYASILLWFAILTTAVGAAMRGSRKNRTRPRSEE